MRANNLAARMVRAVVMVIAVLPGFVSWQGKAWAQGSLLLMGGGSDSRAWAWPVFSWFVQQADSGKIINIDVDEAAPSYAMDFIAWGASASSHPLQIATRAQANDSSVCRELLSASGIFIEGGDQWDYVATWKGTLVERAIEEVFARGGVIGGTSAGLAVLGEVVFDAAYGTAYPDQVAYDPYHSRVHFTDDFLDLLPGVLTDSHFQTRARLGRLVPMLARRIQDHGQPHLLAIGVDESTALCVNRDMTAVVYGLGSVTFLYASEDSRIVCQPRRPVTFTNICFDQLVGGAVYDLRTRTLLEPGPHLMPLPGGTAGGCFVPVVLHGGVDSTAELGEVVITSLTSNEQNAFFGRLGQRRGQGLVPHSVITPNLWANRTYAPNRLVGGEWGAATNPHCLALFLAQNSVCNVSAEGVLTVDGLAYVLDTFAATHAGVPPGTNVPGIVGARLHFLASGDQYDLAHHQVVSSAGGAVTQAPRRHSLVRNFPNPFVGSSTFEYFVPTPGQVRLGIFNVRGQMVEALVDQFVPAGWHRLVWHPALPQGTYLYRLVTPAGVAQGKCVLK